MKQTTCDVFSHYSLTTDTTFQGEFQVPFGTSSSNIQINNQSASENFGGTLISRIYFLRQIERLHQEDRHLRACDRAIRAVDTRTTAAGDAFNG
jgi:hypothetical protein